MKKLIFTVGVLAVICVGAFVFLLSQATPDKAPQDIVVIDLTEQAGK